MPSQAYYTGTHGQSEWVFDGVRGCVSAWRISWFTRACVSEECVSVYAEGVVLM